VDDAELLDLVELEVRELLTFYNFRRGGDPDHQRERVAGIERGKRRREGDRGADGGGG